MHLMPFIPTLSEGLSLRCRTYECITSTAEINHRTTARPRLPAKSRLVFSDESARSIRSSGRATPHSETIQLVENAPLTGEALLCKVTLPLFNFINVERICSSSIALAVSFFSRREDFPRSSLGPGWLELPIADCRLKRRCANFLRCPPARHSGSIEIRQFQPSQSAIENRQSAGARR